MVEFQVFLFLMRLVIFSIRFYNPGYGLEPEDVPKPILQPGQHEYFNPVDMYDQDLRTASNEVLQRVRPLVKLDD